MNIVSFLLYFGISIILALIVNKYIISKYKGNTKRGLYVVNIILFILAGLASFTISRIHNWVSDIIDAKINFVEDIIIKTYPDNILVTSGINIEKAHDGIDELRNLLPESIIEDDNIISLIIDGQYKKYVNIVFHRLESKINIVTRYAKNGVLTLSSFITAIKNIAFSYCNKVFLVARLIVFGIMGIYVVCCNFMRKENILSYNKSITFGED
jgi:hypothetical protein